MAFTGLKKYHIKIKQRFMYHVKPEIKLLSERKKQITWKEYSEIIEYCLSQCGRELGKYELAKHYNDAIIREFMPLIIKRFKEIK